MLYALTHLQPVAGLDQPNSKIPAPGIV